MGGFRPKFSKGTKFVIGMEKLKLKVRHFDEGCLKFIKFKFSFYYLPNWKKKVETYIFIDIILILYKSYYQKIFIFRALNDE